LICILLGSSVAAEDCPANSPTWIDLLAETLLADPFSDDYSEDTFSEFSHESPGIATTVEPQTNHLIDVTSMILSDTKQKNFALFHYVEVKNEPENFQRLHYSHTLHQEMNNTSGS
jgi:hypothetical protein